VSAAGIAMSATAGRCRRIGRHVGPDGSHCRLLERVGQGDVATRQGAHRDAREQIGEQGADADVGGCGACPGADDGVDDGRHRVGAVHRASVLRRQDPTVDMGRGERLTDRQGCGTHELTGGVL